MREALKPVKMLLKVCLILAIAAYPVTMIVQFFSKTKQPFTSYNHTIAFIFGGYWDWIIVGILSLFFLRSDVFFKSVNQIRNRHYELEFIRWKNTPYIAPLHLLYLLSPPVATTDDKMSNAFDQLYKTVITDFRDRVFINAKSSFFEPEQKPSLYAIIGRTLSSQLIVNSLMLVGGVIGILYINPITNLFDGWGKAFIPFAVLFLSRNFHILNAIRLFQPSKIYKRIQQQFGLEDPKITWLELFPNSPYGDSILFAWRADSEKRQRLAYELSNNPVPVKMEYKSTGLAPKPFPSEDLPLWANEAVRSFQEQQSQWKANMFDKNKEIEKSSDGKVVAFPKRG